MMFGICGNDIVTNLVPGVGSPIAPSGPTVLDFTTGSLAAGVVFTRGSSATYFDNTGTLQTAITDAPRFDYDPAALSIRGLLLETAATNQLLRNRSLGNAVWTALNCTPANALGIDNVSSQIQLTATASNATLLQVVTGTAVNRTMSVYVKGTTVSGFVDITQDNLTWTAVACNSSTFTRGQFTQSVLNPTCGYRLRDSGDVVTFDYGQLEGTNTFASSALLTNGASVTRSGDSAVQLASGYYNAAQGTIIAEYMLMANAVNQKIYTFSPAGLETDFVSLTCAAGTGAAINAVSASSCSFALGVSSPLTVHKVAMAYAVNDFAAALDGGTVQTDATGATPVGVDTLYIGRRGTGTTQETNGWIRKITYYPTRLSNAQLQTLST